MKSLVYALVAAVALAAGAPAQAAKAEKPQAGVTSGQAVSAHITGEPHWHYTKKKTGYWYKGRWYPSSAYRAPRRAAKPSAWAATAKAAGSKKWQLPEYAPKYSAGGKYIPTTFIYQQTNGEFRILTPTAAPSAPAGATRSGTPGGAAELRRALQNMNQQGGAQPPAPPQTPGGGATAPGGGTAPAARPSPAARN